MINNNLLTTNYTLNNNTHTTKAQQTTFQGSAFSPVRPEHYRMDNHDVIEISSTKPTAGKEEKIFLISDIGSAYRNFLKGVAEKIIENEAKSNHVPVYRYDRSKIFTLI